MYKAICRLQECIENYDIITIFRHVSPDSDALGSQFGMKLWIEEHYPAKKVYALGFDQPIHNEFPRMDQVQDDVISASLAIVVDTANGARVDDQRYQDAAFSLKIDHHILVDSFCDEEIVHEQAGATCEILASMFQVIESKLSSQCAQYLYGGIIADTLKFSIRSTTQQTLFAAAYLLSFGVDIPKVNEMNFSSTLQQFKYENFIRSNCQVMQGCLAYMIIDQDAYESYDLTFAQAKEKVFVMNGVMDFEIWALFTEKQKDEQGRAIYTGSLRSRNKAIDDIAQQYHGGGHHLACGVKQLLREDIERLLRALLERAKQ